jgi:hypothetical protein
MFALGEASCPLDALRELGASRVQVNVDDADVAPAMRIPHTTPPIVGFVSVWDGDVAGIAGLPGVLGGWEVEERRPIDPPETWDGSRADALANVAVLRRPAELPVEEWRHRWLVDHTPVAIETQGTFGYLQNVVLAPVTPLPDSLAGVSALVEELFPMAAIHDVHAFYGSGGDDAELAARLERLMASVARFGADRDLDLVPTSRYLHDPTR